MSEARRRYRIDLSARDFLRATCRRDGGLPQAGRVMDASAAGVRLRFAGATATGLDIGTEVELRFQHGRDVQPIRADARVARRSAVDDGFDIGFEILDADAFHDSLPPALRPWFNLRSAPRNETIDNVVSPASVEADGVRHAGALLDVSVSGVGLWVSCDDETALQSGSPVRVNFQLPSEDGMLAIPGTIRHRRVIGERLELGISFVWSRSDTAVQDRDRIEGFLDWAA